MTTNSIDAQHDALLALLVAMTTSRGNSFSTVSPDKPVLAPSPGTVEAWLEPIGNEEQRRLGGGASQVQKFWGWQVSIGIWLTDDPAANSLTTRDFFQAVDDLLLMHIRGGVALSTGVVIQNQVAGTSKVIELDVDGSLYRVVQWKFALEELATYTIVD